MEHNILGGCDDSHLSGLYGSKRGEVVEGKHLGFLSKIEDMLPVPLRLITLL